MTSRIRNLTPDEVLAKQLAALAEKGSVGIVKDLMQTPRINNIFFAGKMQVVDLRDKESVRTAFDLYRYGLVTLTSELRLDGLGFNYCLSRSMRGKSESPEQEEYYSNRFRESLADIFPPLEEFRYRKPYAGLLGR